MSVFTFNFFTVPVFSTMNTTFLQIVYHLLLISTTGRSWCTHHLLRVLRLQLPYWCLIYRGWLLR
jgi:hypothetical protein